MSQPSITLIFVWYNRPVSTSRCIIETASRGTAVLPRHTRRLLTLDWSTQHSWSYKSVNTRQQDSDWAVEHWGWLSQGLDCAVSDSCSALQSGQIEPGPNDNGRSEDDELTITAVTTPMCRDWKVGASKKRRQILLYNIILKNAIFHNLCWKNPGYQMIELICYC